MARRIREDFDGVVQAYEYGRDGQRIGAAYSLPAGAVVPDEVDVPAHLLEPDEQDPGGPERGVFDPSDRNIHQVQEYLLGVSDAERRRVLGLEARGHGRKGLLVDGPYAGFAPQSLLPGGPGSEGESGQDGGQDGGGDGDGPPANDPPKTPRRGAKAGD